MLHWRHAPVRGARCIAGDRRAASALEFALLAPVLMLMLTGIVQFGSIYILQNNMQNVAREVSLRLAMGDLALEAAGTWAVERLPAHIDRYGVEVSQAGGMFDVAVTAPMAQAVPLDPLGFFRTGTLMARATARQVAL